MTDDWKNAVVDVVEMSIKSSKRRRPRKDKEVKLYPIEWVSLDEDGRPDTCHGNFAALLEDFGVTVRYDAFAMRYEAVQSRDRAPLTDNLVSDIYHHGTRNGMKQCWEQFNRWIKAEARQDTFHPLGDYLSGLSWDGVPRLDRWLITYAGVEDTPLNRAFGRCHLVASIGRIWEPGLKHDAMLVLEGPERKGKSLLLRVLADGTTDAKPFGYFTDQLSLGEGGRVLLEKTAGKWIVEFAELEGMSKREAQSIKRFISAKEDADTLKYDKFKTEAARQFTMWGTTNDRHYLKSLTGNRRFWPVECGDIDIQRLLADRDQLLAEAVAVWTAGGTPHLLPEHLWEEARQRQAEREEILDDPWMEILSDALKDLDVDDKRPKKDVWELVSIFTRSRQTAEAKRLNAIMERLGFKACMNAVGERQWRRVQRPTATYSDLQRPRQRPVALWL